MRYTLIIFSALLFLTSCGEPDNILYRSKAYTLYSDKVEQGTNVAHVLSEFDIISNYRSLAHENYSRLITFKFSINEKDNEKAPLADHWLIIGDEHESPVITFGEDNSPVPVDPGTKLPVNYSYTFRLDMRNVLNQFKTQGYYETYNGTKIAESDFKNVFIAGGSEPLTWDFSNLEEQNLALKDDDGDGIYEITLTLNPFNASKQIVNEWQLTEDISSKPHYTSDQPIVDALFNLSLEEALKNIEPDSTLRTGAEWGGVWTRDVSYSTLLAFAYHEPRVAMISLKRKVNRKRIVQDTGSGGAWPVSSDRTTWALAAWEIYKVTGDADWLAYAYEVIKNTLDDDYLTIKSDYTNMYKGESSFLDWREQTYPKWMSNKDIYVSENLGTNVVHYEAHKILADMAKLLDQSYKLYEDRADSIKQSINDYLWMDDKGYYAQYLYGRNYLIFSPRFEALGETLSILFDVADTDKAQSIISNSPVTDFGVTCIYPQIPGIPPYHNNAIWPFVQSYWNLAAAKVGNEDVLNHGLAAIYRAGAFFLSNYENFVAQNGDYVGTEINSNRMLWSMAGNLAMVHRVFIGMHFEFDGIRFQPVVPKAYRGHKKLTNFHYRKANLTIEVSGYGNKIASISLDGTPLKEAFLPGSITGNHNIKIVLSNNSMENRGIHLVENHFSTENPLAKIIDNKIVWNKLNGAVTYAVYFQDSMMKLVTDTSFLIPPKAYGEYRVTALDSSGYESFSCEPLSYFNPEDVQIIEMENIVSKSIFTYTNYSGKGFVELSPAKNTKIPISVQVPEDSKYRIDFRYSNGTGPWNTDNNCAIRSLYVNNEYKGVVVMPQRGQEEWSDWGFTNSIVLSLKKGKNILTLSYEDWNTNMDGKINDAMLDYLRITKIE